MRNSNLKHHQLCLGACVGVIQPPRLIHIGVVQVNGNVMPDKPITLLWYSKSESENFEFEIFSVQNRRGNKSGVVRSSIMKGFFCGWIDNSAPPVLIDSENTYAYGYTRWHAETLVHSGGECFKADMCLPLEFMDVSDALYIRLACADEKHTRVSAWNMLDKPYCGKLRQRVALLV